MPSRAQRRLSPRTFSTRRSTTGSRRCRRLAQRTLASWPGFALPRRQALGTVLARADTNARCPLLCDCGCPQRFLINANAQTGLLLPLASCSLSA